MSHKDYVKLAGALAEARAELSERVRAGATSGTEGEYNIEAVEVRISRILADDNPAFDRHRFHMAAIGQPVSGRDRPR